MNKTEWLGSLKPKDKAIYVRSDGTMELVTTIEIKAYCNETLAKVITEKQEYLSAHWVNVESLFEPTEHLRSEIELKKKADRLKNCMWQSVDNDKINAVYDILFGDQT